MSKKAKYKAKPQSHDGDYDVVDPEGWSICTAFTQANARKIACALNAMEAEKKPKAKPFAFDWRGVPKVSQWAAMDGSLSWFAYKSKPWHLIDVWTDGDQPRMIARPPYPGDWRESLQERPTK